MSLPFAKISQISKALSTPSKAPFPLHTYYIPPPTSSSSSYTTTATANREEEMEYVLQGLKYVVHNHLSKSPLYPAMEYYLVNHPNIQNFTWKQGQTPASSKLFLALTVLAYLSATFLLSRMNLPYIGSRFLRTMTVIHNVILLTISFTMAVGCTLSMVLLAPKVDYLVCYPKNTKPTGPLFFWSYVFYLSKYVEYVDTLLIILSNSARRLTFLHVYHHATVVIMCYMSLHNSQSLFPGVLVTNSTVHVIMYFYYLLCALGMRPKWKKLVTDCQIVQFFLSFAIMAWIFYYHITGPGCSGILSWCFDLVFITSLLALFLDFRSKNYSKNTNTNNKNNIKSKKDV